VELLEREPPFLCTCLPPQLADVAYKQNKARFYRISAFITADAIVRIPLAMLDSVLFGTLIYW
jgi:hypothetical protein